MNLGQRQILVCGLILKWIPDTLRVYSIHLQSNRITEATNNVLNSDNFDQDKDPESILGILKDTANITEHEVSRPNSQRTHIAEPIPGIGVRRFQRCTYVPSPTSTSVNGWWMHIKPKEVV